MGCKQKIGFRWLVGLGFISLMLSGCVSEKIEPEHAPRLGVSQSNNGWLTFHLETEPGYKYQIQYKDPKDGSWNSVDGCDSIKGSGEVIEIRKRFNPRKTVPQFTVNYSKY